MRKKAKQKPTGLLIQLWLGSLTLTLLALYSKWNVFTNPFLASLQKVITDKSNLIYFAFFIISVFFFSVVFFQHQKKQKWVELQRSKNDLKKLNWKQFEQLVSSAFVRQGWSTRLNGQGGADGGVDLFIKKQTTKGIVQVKHWKGRVGAPVVREQYGLMLHHKAQAVYIVALEGFTKEAILFCKNKPIHLIDGEELLSLLHKSR